MPKPSIPKGTRDFSPTEMAKRNYIFSTIRRVFALYGFAQIETPAMETLATLLGKYGDEGDKLLYKVLDSGDFRHNLSAETFTTATAAQLATTFCEKGLRYDLTVPLARYVVQHRDELQLPFRRYQLQPVWRADRPQKGRYREFYQCDADIVGSTSLLNEVELLQIIDEVFRQLHVRVEIKVNNRKLLAGIAEVINAPEQLTAITVAIDKLDKIGIDNVIGELVAVGLTAEQINTITPLFTLSGSNSERLAQLSDLLRSSDIGRLGITEMTTILDLLRHCDFTNEVVVDLSLARGLNYYTGTIIEVKALDVAIGSITGGGRYDNLTSIFGLPGISGVGISFGADRIYDVLNQLQLYPADAINGTQLLFTNLGTDEMTYAMPLARLARQQGIATEIYPDAVKMKKQMAYANAKGIPFVAITGSDEMAHSTITIRNMLSGAQHSVAISDVDAWLTV